MTFAHCSEVKAYAGFNVVSKKNKRLRKILVQVPTNYMWCSVRDRGSLGLFGGCALSRCYVPSDSLSCAAFDEENCFTRVRPTRWFLELVLGAAGARRTGLGASVPCPPC